MKINHILFATLIIPLQISGLFAQKPLNEKLFVHAKMVPDSVATDFQSLASYLKSPSYSDKETVETIFYWMATHIEYFDDPNFETAYADSIAKTTLLTKKSGCEGTARLFYELCTAAQIECEVVFGISKGYSFERERISGPNHGWDAVKISDKWELVDATWGSGGSTLVGDSAVYITELDMRYFFADPESFIIDHFPQYSKWQLLENPISKKKFLSEDYELLRLAKLTTYN